MLPEYLKYWGLARPPFSLTPDPEMLYMSGQHQEGLLRLKYAVVSNKGGALLVSENAGDGKTSLLARLRHDLDSYYEGRCRSVFIDHPTLTANQMVGEIARQLGVGSGSNDKLTLLNELREHLLTCHRQGVKCVVILDEGQMLCHRPDILQELRILLNFCVSDAFLLTFVLSGQKPLDEAIRAMPEFHQRLPVRFFLRNLGREDTRELIRYRLRRAGAAEGREIFSEDGYAGVYNFSKGCPRVICSVADLSLIIAHSRFSRQVDFVAVSQACSDMNRTEGGYHYFHFLKSFSAEGVESESGPLTSAVEPVPAARPPRETVAPVAEIQSPAPPVNKTEQPPAQPPEADIPGVRVRFAIVEPGQTTAGETSAAARATEPAAVAPVLKRTEGFKCSFCGLELGRGMRLCPNCGEELAAVVEEAKPPAAPPEPEPAAVERSQETGTDEYAPEDIAAPPETAAADNIEDHVTESPDSLLRPGNQPAELELLSGIERWGLRDLISSRSYLERGEVTDPVAEELVALNPGRFWQGGAVAQNLNGGGKVSLCARCALVVRGEELVLGFRGSRERVGYRQLRQVRIEPLQYRGKTLLHRLVLETSQGLWALSLPLHGEPGQALAQLLARYISVRAVLLGAPDFSASSAGAKSA
ncbi:AAA family ATPase [bacterium]|nr:AAA family ATPase [bacterium]